VKKEFDASNEQEVKRAEQKAKNQRDTEIADLKNLLSSKRGRRIVWRILEQTGMHRTSFTGNSTTFFNEGQRNIGLWLVEQVLSADTDAYLEMVKENRLGDQDA